jgi:hypothetical protein
LDLPLGQNPSASLEVSDEIFAIDIYGNFEQKDVNFQL